MLQQSILGTHSAGERTGILHLFFSCLCVNNTKRKSGTFSQQVLSNLYLRSYLLKLIWKFFDSFQFWYHTPANDHSGNDDDHHCGRITDHNSGSACEAVARSIGHHPLCSGARCDSRLPSRWFWCCSFLWCKGQCSKVAVAPNTQLISITFLVRYYYFLFFVCTGVANHQCFLGQPILVEATRSVLRASSRPVPHSARCLGTSNERHKKW